MSGAPSAWTLNFAEEFDARIVSFVAFEDGSAAVVLERAHGPHEEVGRSAVELLPAGFNPARHLVERHHRTLQPVRPYPCVHQLGPLLERSPQYEAPSLRRLQPYATLRGDNCVEEGHASLVVQLPPNGVVREGRKLVARHTHDEHLLLAAVVQDQVAPQDDL
eukprot:CAMPEP_0170157062 /NCGR_PEP_ID=MMETSP0033_2-20121228/64852_1 /TAXON_ID=195969 /ORGANISM="Dolichomastix tenuilepis, Strain CCMP3274" /LENGTH=162 /DNA_ID=CAMNT_0010394451 /DNA_START=92 /DNA_END=577 /DNA_ORIENTATION=+